MLQSVVFFLFVYLFVWFLLRFRKISRAIKKSSKMHKPNNKNLNSNSIWTFEFEFPKGNKNLIHEWFQHLCDLMIVVIIFFLVYASAWTSVNFSFAYMLFFFYKKIFFFANFLGFANWLTGWLVVFMLIYIVQRLNFNFI